LGALAFSVKPFQSGFIRSVATLARGSLHNLAPTAT